MSSFSILKNIEPKIIKKIEKSFTSTVSIFDMGNKFNSHFFSKNHPFDLKSKLNFSYDCFILSMHYDFSCIFLFLI